MKLTDFLQNVGRPVAYYPSLRRVTGSTNATILLCQFIYWRGKENDAKGWLYKDSAEIEQETGLSYDEQKTARAKLKEAGILEEHYARLDHQMKFRLNLDAINSLWGIDKDSLTESGNAVFGNEETSFSLNELTESTTENTTEKAADAAKPDLVDLELSKLPLIQVKHAITEHFLLNVNWETKFGRQWLEWAKQEGITPAQVARAANTWRSDKRFNWQPPTLKGIFEKWQMLQDSDENDKPKARAL